MKMEEISSLRKHQFILLNSGMAVMFFILIASMELGLSMRAFYAGLIVFMLAQVITTIRIQQPLLYVFSEKMRKLMQYEQEKMGTQWKTQQKLIVVLQSFLILMFLFQAWVMGDQPFYFPGERFYLAGVYLFTIALVNISTFIHNRKIDKQTAEELNGYTKKMLVFSLVFTALFFILGLAASSFLLIL
jgi:glucan phosphoethanolaminetransferase (alkaline phosphatase superfamily)